MATDIDGLSRALPAGLRARVATDDDLHAMVGFANCWATPSQWTEMGYTPETPTSLYEKKLT
ncbi:MAG: hypothetical protein M3R54_04410 [Chloroflexota bacterium]|nr:hypothetical protein [Chloroflexota bacterium]